MATEVSLFESLWEQSGQQFEVRKDGYITAAGSVDQRIYLIERGSVRVYFLHDGEERTVR